MSKQCDVLIVGAGAAGLTAAIYAARKNLKVIVLDKSNSGGQTANAIWIENFPGFEKIKGKELMQKVAAQAKGFGVEIIEAIDIAEIKKSGNSFFAETSSGTIEAKAIILATGTKHKHLNVPGEKEFYGKGVSYCATCDGPFFRKQRVAVIGAGNSGITAALSLAEITTETIIIEFLPQMICDPVYCDALKKTKIKFFGNTAVTEIFGKENVEGIKIKDRASGKEETIPIDGVFIYVGLLPENDLAKKVGAKLNERGFVIVNENLETSVPGVFAAGDITGNFAQAVWAAAEGAKAATNAFNYLKKLS
jgi:thioredoxin reductase (NADPH)